jgi:thiol-disulfide isomerase/thioredoxin
MKRFMVGLALVGLWVSRLGAAEEVTTASAAMEQQVREIVAGPQVTLVHFWAPWCPNCHAEMKPEGWAKFIAANPEVKVVFINFWHRGMDPKRVLETGQLGAQPNLLLLTHPSEVSRAGEGRVNEFLGLPVTWLPTTWVFREGRMRYALNYGEVRFDMLQQLVSDAQDKWTH